MTAVETSGRSGTQRAVLLMTASSLLVPLAGIASAPLLSHALGVTGRGEVAAAVAPNVLIASVATFGLPEALVFFLARRPWLTRRGIRVALVTSLLVGGIAFAAAVLALPFLSAGNPLLSSLILVGTALVLPQMAINVLRGAASGRQMWGFVAIEKTVGSLLRVLVLLALSLLGRLDVWTAVITITSTPVVAGLIYLKLLGRPPARAVDDVEEDEPRFVRALHVFGARVWIGAVANMLLARFGQLFFAPISNTVQLGLYIVAVTISDVPLIVALAVRDALYGVNSKDPDAGSLASISRVATFVGFVACLVLGASLPFWIRPVFGDGFGGAVVPAWILMLSTIANIPGFLTAAGLSAWGRPGLRSIGLLIGLLGNVPVFFVLVPPLGANGAAIAALISSVLSTAFMVTAARRVIGLPVTAFLIARPSDIDAVRQLAVRMLRRPARG